MKLEEQVASLELAKKLKELGVKQKSLFTYWSNGVEFLLNQTSSLVFMSDRPSEEKEKYSAFTVAELGKLIGNALDRGLDQDIPKDLQVEKIAALWEPDYLAKMLIYLIENKLITP